MATLKTTTVSRFHNLSDEALADAIGRADAIVKGAEAELAALKDEFKARGLSDVVGDDFTVTATEQIWAGSILRRRPKTIAPCLMSSARCSNSILDGTCRGLC